MFDSDRHIGKTQSVVRPERSWGTRRELYGRESPRRPAGGRVTDGSQPQIARPASRVYARRRPSRDIAKSDPAGNPERTISGDPAVVRPRGDIRSFTRSLT